MPRNTTACARVCICVPYVCACVKWYFCGVQHHEHEHRRFCVALTTLFPFPLHFLSTAVSRHRHRICPGLASSGYFLAHWLIVFVVVIVALFGTSQHVSGSVYVCRATQLRVLVCAFAYCAGLRVCDSAAFAMYNTTNTSTAAPLISPPPSILRRSDHTVSVFFVFPFCRPCLAIVIVSARGLHLAVGPLLGLLLAGVLLQTKQFVSDCALHIIPRLLYVSTDCAQ